MFLNPLSRKVIPRFWQTMLHGSELNVMDEDGETIIGFFTMRKSIAWSGEEAERKALERLVKEPKMIRLFSLHQATSGSDALPSIVPVKTEELTWFQWLTGSYAKGLIFYGSE